MPNEGRDLTVILSRLVDQGDATPVRGPPVKIDGETCQEWRVEFNHLDQNALNQNPTYSVCLDTRTHLPRQILVGKGSVVTTYSDWNAPMDIEAPPSNVEVAKD